MMAGNDAAAAVPDRLNRFTTGEFGKATPEGGAAYLIYVDWPEFFLYYMMMVKMSCISRRRSLKTCTSGTSTGCAAWETLPSALMAVMATHQAPPIVASAMATPSKAAGEASAGQKLVKSLKKELAALKRGGGDDDDGRRGGRGGGRGGGGR
jgi:hypothetical protein